MRDLRIFDQHRVRGANKYGGPGYAFGGTFVIRCNSTGRLLSIIASNGDGWDHVSVSLPSRTPTWEEMAFVKQAFFKDDETAMQLHVPPRDHINLHKHCLHLWRPHKLEIPLPPVIFV